MKTIYFLLIAWLASINTIYAQCTVDASLSNGDIFGNITDQMGQSFTACTDGTLSTLKFLSIYDLTDGDVLDDGNLIIYTASKASTLATIPMTEITFVKWDQVDHTTYSSIDLSGYSIPVTNGSEYIFEFSYVYGIGYHDANQYDGGDIYLSGSAIPGFDLIFEMDITAAPSDTDPPVVQGISLSGNHDDNASSVTYQVSFDENANNISIDDFELVTTGTATASIASVSSTSGTSVNVVVNSIANEGTIRLNLKSSTDIQDDLGNSGVASYSSGESQNVDRIAPTVTVTSLKTNDATPSLSGTVNDNFATVIVTVNSEVKTASVSNGIWTIADDELSSMSEGTYNVSVTATDEAGNSGSDSSTDELVIDLTAPSVTVTSLTTNDATPSLSGTVDDNNTTVTVTVNSEVKTASVSNGIWTIADDELSSMSEGTYNVSVTATDEAGNSGSDSSTDELVIDLTAPSVTVTSLTTNDATPSLSGTVDDNISTVTVTVNSEVKTASVSNGIWTIADDELSSMSEGTYDVSVSALDAAGNSGSDSSTDELVIDLTAPSVTVTSLTTNDATPSLSGTVDDNSATVTVTVNSEVKTASVSNGTWTIADNELSSLSEGTYDVSVSALDAAGNSGSDSSTDELVIDLTAPIVTVTSLTTNDATPSLSGTVDDNSATVTVTVNSEVKTASVSNGTWTISDNELSSLSEGTYDVSVSALDAAGNSGSDSSTDELVIDLTAPIVTVTSLTTNDATPSLSGTVDDNSATVTVTVNSEVKTANVSNGTWTISDNELSSLSEGTYDVSVSALDAAGNSGSDSSTDELVIDLTAPIVTVTSLTTNDATPSLSGTVDDNSATVTVTVNSEVKTANVNNGTWSIADDELSSMSEGTYDVSVSALDAAGNSGSDSSTDELVIDLTAPSVTVTSLTTNDATPLLSGTVDDNIATVTVTVNSEVKTASVSNGTWTISDNELSSMSEGTYDVSVSALDAAGNSGSDSSNDELVIDLTAPSVTVTSLTTNDATPLLSGTVDDNNATVTVTVNSEVKTASVSNGTWTISDNELSSLSEGTYDVTVKALDAAGNSGSDSSTDELVIDLTAPSVTVTSLTTNDATPSLSGTVDDNSATVTVTVNSEVKTANVSNGTWTISDNELSSLPEGIYDVSVIATDKVGNSGSDKSTNELVIDMTAPTVSLSTSVSSVTNENPISVKVTFSESVTGFEATDVTISGGTVTNFSGSEANYSFDVIPNADGNITVNISSEVAMDAVNNSNTVAEQLSVEYDGTAPVVTVDELETNDNTPSLTGSIDDADATIKVSVDGQILEAINHGDGKWSIKDNALSELENGTYDVKVTAVDEVGNQGVDTTEDELSINVILSASELKVDFSVYPNPATNQLFISTNIDHRAINILQVYNTMGMLMDVPYTNGILNVSNLPHGQYFVKIQLNDTSVFKRFIKN
ncbi:Ig-like domain-containing protein [Flammeovirga sp. SubArs3]|uniref:Ig-like domain-containing protein n=1 Tax=Flammeovirga sp. SubArs3 TaxID=2995316 RepID=UPI00248ABE72|nr:Ig-like domain-containing protein [Flammeovirga sp. SubArs3]